MFVYVCHASLPPTVTRTLGQGFTFAGVYSEEEAIKRLLPQRLRDQYAFKTKSALDALVFSEVMEV